VSTRELEPRRPIAVGQTGEDLLRTTGPVQYAEGETDEAWRALCGALSVLLDPIAEMVRDDEEGNPGWTALASPRRCMPAWLHVLAQWAGIRRWDALSEADLRELIGPRAPGVWRGTRAAMIAAVRRFFPPGFEAERWLWFQERADGDPYKLRVFTYTFVPGLDYDAVREALAAAKPALLYPFIYEVRRGQSYLMLERREGTYAQMRADYPDYAAVLSDEPI
jgi:hypothetical protein